MKNANGVISLILLFCSMFVSSCEAIAGIFKAGMGFGIFIMVVIIAAIIYLITRIGRNRKV